MHAFCWFVRPENEFIDTFRSLDLFDDEQEGIAFCHMFSGGQDCGLANKPCSLGGNLFVAMDEQYPHPPIVPTGWCVQWAKVYSEPKLQACLGREVGTCRLVYGVEAWLYEFP